MSSPRTPARPAFLIIGGPNGSGKSSTYQGSDVETGNRAFRIINPDLLTARIQAVERLDLRDANLEAVKRIEAWLEASIDAHQTVGVKTNDCKRIDFDAFAAATPLLKNVREVARPAVQGMARYGPRRRRQ